MADDRPSIAEMQRIAASKRSWIVNEPVLRNIAVPVLLEIVSAALDVDAASKLGAGYGYDNEPTYEQITSWRTTLQSAEARLATALSKVRP